MRRPASGRFMLQPSEDSEALELAQLHPSALRRLACERSAGEETNSGGGRRSTYDRRPTTDEDRGSDGRRPTTDDRATMTVTDEDRRPAVRAPRCDCLRASVRPRERAPPQGPLTDEEFEALLMKESQARARAQGAPTVGGRSSAARLMRLDRSPASAAPSQSAREEHSEARVIAPYRRDILFSKPKT